MASTDDDEGVEVAAGASSVIDMGAAACSVAVAAAGALRTPPTQRARATRTAVEAIVVGEGGKGRNSWEAKKGKGCWRTAGE